MRRASQRRGLALALCAAIAGWGAASPASAQDDDLEEEEDYYSRSGVYLQALFTSNIGRYEFPNVVDNGAQFSSGVAGALGYRFKKRFAVEAFGDWVSGWDLKQRRPPVPEPDLGDVVAGLIGMNAKVFFAGGRLQPYFLAGLGAAYTNVVRSDVGLGGMEWDLGVRLGLGLDWYINEELGLSLVPMYVLPTGIGDDLYDSQYVSIGVGAFIRFGGE